MNQNQIAKSEGEEVNETQMTAKMMAPALLGLV